MFFDDQTNPGMPGGDVPAGDPVAPAPAVDPAATPEAPAEGEQPAA